jgi:ABC-type amino acid transport substrate-binding protein
MKRTPLVLLALLAGLAGGLLGASLLVPHGGQASVETAYQRVLRTNTLRCGYVIYPTYVEKDPTTGKLSGMFYDLVNALGKNLGIKVEWNAEMSFDNIFEGFQNHRYDALCPGFWRTPGRAHGGDFTAPLVFTPVYLYVRADDNRFKSLADFDNPNITFSTMDGEATETVVRQRFPHAKVASLPGMSPAGDRFLAVINHKADATMMEGGIGGEFMAANPGKIKPFTAQPMMTGASVVVIPHGEYDLKSFLDAGIAGMLESGELAQIVAKYRKYPGAVLLPTDEFKLDQ